MQIVACNWSRQIWKLFILVIRVALVLLLVKLVFAKCSVQIFPYSTAADNILRSQILVVSVSGNNFVRELLV